MHMRTFNIHAVISDGLPLPLTGEGPSACSLGRPPDRGSSEIKPTPASGTFCLCLRRRQVSKRTDRSKPPEISIQGLDYLLMSRSVCDTRTPPTPNSARKSISVAESVAARAEQRRNKNPRCLKIFGMGNIWIFLRQMRHTASFN